MSVLTTGAATLAVTAGPLSGRRISLRGEPKIKNLGGKLDASANLDSTMSREFTPDLVRFEVTFERPQKSLTREDLLGFHDLVLTETHAGRVHYFLDATLVGEMDDSVKTGEISGLSIACAPADYSLTEA